MKEFNRVLKGKLSEQESVFKHSMANVKLDLEAKVKEMEVQVKYYAVENNALKEKLAEVDQNHAVSVVCLLWFLVMLGGFE